MKTLQTGHGVALPNKMIPLAEPGNMPPSPFCIKCGGPLETAIFVQSWDAHGVPEQSEPDYVCRRCDVRWEECSLKYLLEVKPGVDLKRPDLSSRGS